MAKRLLILLAACFLNMQVIACPPPYKMHDYTITISQKKFGVIYMQRWVEDIPSFHIHVGFTSFSLSSGAAKSLLLFFLLAPVLAFTIAISLKF